MKILRLSLIFSFLFAPVGASANSLDISGLSHPRSVIQDTKSGSYFISNVNGDASERDNNGYISKVNSDGLVVVLHFIEPKEAIAELHAPKGMAIFDEMLYVTDLDVIRTYDLDTGDPGRIIDLSQFEPQLLTDIAVDPDGAFYVSDKLGNQIFKIRTLDSIDAVKIFLSGENLGSPNGLYYDHHRRRLIIVTAESGQILEATDDADITVIKDGLQTLDGVFMDQNKNLIVSSLIAGEIYSIKDKGRGALSLLETGLPTPADIAYDSIHHRVLVPFTSDNRVSAIDL